MVAVRFLIFSQADEYLKAGEIRLDFLEVNLVMDTAKKLYTDYVKIAAPE